MSDRNFRALLEAQWARGNFVCVGLDSELGKIPEAAQVSDPEETLYAFNFAIVNATHDLVCAFKPNIAFYEACGPAGLRALRRTIAHILDVAPEAPVILDAKRADIGNTNAGYVQMAFEYLRADAITVNPYLGRTALRPFLDRGEKGIIVLCRTSNEGADEFQDMPVQTDWAPDGTMPLYQYVALKVGKEWDLEENCGLVVGATYPEELAEVRRIVGDMPILIPGVGFQQKDVPLEEQVKQVVSAGKDSRGEGMIVNSSRGIIFASSGPDFAEAARRETQKLRDLINTFRGEVNYDGRT